MSEIRINVRTTADIKREVTIAALLRGMTVSSLVNSLLVTTIREEKEYNPTPFREAERKVILEEMAADLTERGTARRIFKEQDLDEIESPVNPRGKTQQVGIKKGKVR